MRSAQDHIVNWLMVTMVAALPAGMCPRVLAQVDQTTTMGRLTANPSTKPAAREAEPYLKLPIQRLKAVVPGLGGIKYDDSQEQLPLILNRVAKQIANELPRLPDLISREDVFHFQSAADGDAMGSLAAIQPWSRQFKYLLECKRNPDGSTSIAESRIDGAGKLVKEYGGLTSVRGYGFSNLWLLFTAANQREFHFRYLGMQEKSGRKTYVVAFAQEPKKVFAPAFFEVNNNKVPFYYQGILWVDQSTFNIVHLRTDLLAPLPQLSLEQLTTELTFRSVVIHGYDAVFWLPSEVDISSDQGRGPS